MGMRQREFFNNDIFFDVLSRLPSKTLLGWKCVSKEWYRLISDRSFIQVQLRKSGTISGFFYQEKFKWCNEDIKTLSYVPVELESDEVRKVTFDFLPEDVVVLASCSGLICCRSCFPCQESAIYICNPSNKEWVKLRCPALKREDNIALAFDPLQDPVDDSTNFKVVRLGQYETAKGDSEFSFDIYSSETGSWTKSKEICQFNSNIYKNNGIFVGGVLYWLTDGEQILTFNIAGEWSLLIPVPVPAAEFKSIPVACIGESKGRLHYVMVSEEGIHVWLLEEVFDSKWELQHFKSLEEMEGKYPSFFCNLQHRVESRSTSDMEPWMDPWAFKDGLLLMKVGPRVYLYNVDEDKVEEVCHAVKLGSRSYCPRVVPYAMTLVPLKQA